LINPELHKKPTALDRDKHRNLKLRTALSNLKASSGMNSLFLTTAEFGDACKEYPILFIAAGKDEQGKEQVAPVAVFGVTQGENLFLQANGRWDAFYVPAALRAYPFTMARVGPDQFAVVLDESWEGFSTEEGEAIFGADGQPTPRMMELKLLQPKRFDATLPDGSTLTVDGFLAVDEERLAQLTDADTLELARNGLLSLLHAHQISMGNMRRLIDRRVAAVANKA
jgi:hypothetical protein